MKEVEAKYHCLPFWSWNDDLEPEELERQIEWMHKNGVGGFFMHARGGLTTPYLGTKWFECVEASGKKAQELGMEAYAYDENGWPSGFAGGKLLTDIENHDRYLTADHGPYDPAAKVCYDDSGVSLRRVTKGDNLLRVYDHYSPSTADILNGEVVDQFIALTHEQYRKRDDYGLKGFFTDEPQYFRWGSGPAFTKVLPAYYEETYHEDFLDGVGLLFEEKEGYEEFRYRYWLSMQHLMLQNWAKKIDGWCHKNGYQLTGHYCEESSLQSQMMCCAGISSFYEYEDIPGVDWLGRNVPFDLTPKQVGSVASQLGKKQVLAEEFACCGWDVTPLELKRIAEALMAGGVNLMCLHLMPYDERGQRKRDYPAHYSSVNPWVKKDFKYFNDYFAALGKILAESEEIAPVGLFHPIRSAYLKMRKDLPSWGIGELDQKLVEAISRISSAQIPYHLLDETVMEGHAHVEGSTLVVGKCRYSYLVFPRCYTMGKKFESLLHEYVNNGGKVLLLDGKPSYLEGKPYDYPYLKSNITWDELVQAMPFRVKPNASVRSTFRKDKEGKEFWFVTNVSEKATTLSVEKEGASSFRSYDIESEKETLLPLTFTLASGESRLLSFSSEKCLALPPREKVNLGPLFHVVGTPENYLTLDMVSYSKDGIHFSTPYSDMGLFNKLLHDRYEGELYLRYECDIRSLPTHCLLYVEKAKNLAVFCNGTPLIQKGSAPEEKSLLSYDIFPALKVGKNEIVIRFSYFQKQEVYDVLFGEGTESVRNCLTYDSNIESIYLQGDFGVFGEFKPGQTPGVLLGEHFYLDKQKKEIHSLIEDGYPFFRGDIVLEQDLELKNPNVVLSIPGRFQELEVSLSGHSLGKLLWKQELDLSPFAKCGHNPLRLTLTVSNRNLLGPFHCQEEEPIAISPNHFEMDGLWQDGRSAYYRPSYSFVKTIV